MDQGFGKYRCAEPQAGQHDFRETSDVNDAARWIITAEGIAFAVGFHVGEIVVFHNIYIIFLRHGGNDFLLPTRQSGPERIVESGDRIEELNGIVTKMPFQLIQIKARLRPGHADRVYSQEA
ncbi:hypothetical protein D3C76_1043060 [compost metagenome]